MFKEIDAICEEGDRADDRGDGEFHPEVGEVQRRDS
jgi:hypothetical protein